MLMIVVYSQTTTAATSDLDREGGCGLGIYQRKVNQVATANREAENKVGRWLERKVVGQVAGLADPMVHAKRGKNRGSDGEWR